jgi:hypothetical protein
MKHLPNYTSQQRFSSYKLCLELKSFKFSRYTTLPPRPLESNPPTPSREYVASLLDQAAVHDASTSTGGRNPRPARSVNVMELCFDDGMMEQDYNGYENYTHECDFETSIDQIMVNMNDISNKGNLVAMDHASFVWISPHGSLLPTRSNRMGQRLEEGKGKILDYNVNVLTNNGNNNSKFRNNDKRYQTT